MPLEGSKVFLVDPAACDYSGDKFVISSFLESRHLEPEAIVLTHGHFDHIAGLPHLVSCYPGIRIYIHPADAPLVGRNSEAGQLRSLGAMGFTEFLPYVSNLPEPTDYLDDGERILGGWKVFHTPGHTPGSCCLYSEKEKVLLSGDTVFYHSWGRTDLPGGDESVMSASLERIYTIIPKDTLVFSGHDATGFDLSENLP